MFSDWARQLQALYVPTSHLLLQSAQSKLLEHFCAGLSIDSKKSKSGLNYVVVTNKSNSSVAPRGKKTLVLVHGFGSGLGFFFANYRWLSTESYERVIAVDLLGMGGSERVSLDRSPRVTTSQLVYSFFTGNSDKVDSEVVPRSLDFFVDSISEFCEEVVVTPTEPKFHVAGHSLGSLLTWNYAIRHKERVEALLMLSPCGVPAPPPGSATQFSSSSYAISTIRFLWDMNFTPQQIVRAAGSRGLPMVTSVLRRRFNSRWNTLETDLISQYFYHITAAPASGEFALNSLLRPLVYRDEDGVVSTSIFAKRTVEQDIQGLPANSLPFPVLLMFGDHDWLRFKYVERFVSFAKSKGICIDYSLIESAGHHLYVDNPDVMHREIELFRTRHNV